MQVVNTIMETMTAAETGKFGTRRQFYLDALGKIDLFQYITCELNYRQYYDIHGCRDWFICNTMK